MVKNVGGFGHFHHEGGLAGCEIIDGPDAGEDPVSDPDAGGSGGDPAANLSHELNQADLPQVAAFAAGIGPGEHHQIDAAPELHIVGGEMVLHQQLLHNRMAGLREAQLAGVDQHRSAVTATGGRIGEAAEGIKTSNGSRSPADRACHRAYLLPQVAEQLVFPLVGACPQLKDASFPLLQGRGDEALFIGQGLAPDPVIGTALALALLTARKYPKVRWY